MNFSEERGNAAVVILGGAGLVMLLLVGLTDLASFFLARTKAQTAADAAALAAVAELIPSIGENANGKAEQYAAANGGDLVECSCSMGSSVAQVTVAVPVRLTLHSMRTVTASAKAELSMPEELVAGPG